MNGNNTSPPTTIPAQEKVAKSVSTIVLWGTCLFGALGMSIAIVAMSRGNFGESKEILQILFSAILPLFGTWIGTILAYYFSRENLLAANQTVRHLVDNITSDKKLESTKAGDVMIPIGELKYVEYKSGSDDNTFNLKTHFLNFLTEKKISRVILLDENKCAKYVLHKSTIEGFIAEQYFSTQDTGNPPASPPDSPAPSSVMAKELTFADLIAKGNTSVKDILLNGVKFIKEDANLSDAKILVKNFPACNDVFVTKNGSGSEPVLGWITNVTIAENSIV